MNASTHSDFERNVEGQDMIEKYKAHSQSQYVHLIHGARFTTALKLGLSLILGIFFATAVVSGQEMSSPEVRVSAKLVVGESPVGFGVDGKGNATLIVTATVKEGFHIYAQSQPKPFLATRIAVKDNPLVSMLGEFKPEREPIRLRHDDLDVDLHEFEGQIRWSAPVQVLTDANFDNIEIKGEVFAQACEAGRCFAPRTYGFTASSGEPDLMRGTTTVNTGEALIAEAAHSDTTQAEPFELANLNTETNGGSTLSIYAILPLAFVAGFILNFMPCVLPVVGLKVLSFVQQANNNRRKIFMLNLAYSLGTISVLLVLATLATFVGLGWGEQFSSVTFTVILASIVFAFALSFFDVWEIELPGAVGKIEGKEEGLAGAFSKGILSTVLATPCSGPFLGSALAWALVQPTHLTYLVFGTVGLGMASPFLAIGVFPSLVKWLPKPGAWMVGFKQLMGFVMIATVIFLLSFISIPALVPTISLLAAIGLACWFYGQHDPASPASAWKRLGGAAAIMMIATWFSFGLLYQVSQERFQRAAVRYVESQTGSAIAKNQSETEDSEIPWQTYSEIALQAAIADGKTVFVDFTADWCLTCKTNEAVAVDKPEVARMIRDEMIVAFRADKTESAPAVDRLLRQLGNKSASIPFYAVFPKESPSQPVTFDGILPSSQSVLDALKNKAT